MQNVRMTDEYVYTEKLYLIDYDFAYNQNLHLILGKGYTSGQSPLSSDVILFWRTK